MQITKFEEKKKEFHENGKRITCKRLSKKFVYVCISFQNIMNERCFCHKIEFGSTGAMEQAKVKA